ncbi:hypothetical protein AU198_03745 [Mycobacterium sp. GA-1199]|uniref:phthiotriol/phenolphthiotriol dimycocerosates methyltransferase n=1 Tax=Mycobacterium sp. GA-1199 TaxID=1772287 RepID=UPI0007497D7B|nr:class I SAM-dependent methyltransferase [Mycobacterium sp. GA-1199]KUI46685.1 hypothetical protein AU198_03745 [Mycobacterium sp. GA-1199]
MWNLMKRATKLSYPYFTRKLERHDVVFMNYGYETTPPLAIPLSEADEVNRYPIQLYHTVAGQTDLTGKRVLEVGCGHGGGASYLTRTHQPASYTGLDRNRKGIEFCRRRHRMIPGLTFTEGDAEALPFPDGSFDAVINVESSHCYLHPERFFDEVARVLSPGGVFLYTDAWPRERHQDWNHYLEQASLRIENHIDISAEVQAGMLAQADKYRDVGNSGALQILFGLKGDQDMARSQFYRELDGGDFAYRMWLLQKP